MITRRTDAHRGWSGASLSDHDLMKEGVGRDSEIANAVDKTVTLSNGGVHRQLGILPSAHVRQGLPRPGGDDARRIARDCCATPCAPIG